ncbi:MAG TPA: amidohydrolase family protein [Phycicoccus sp.]|nr:amidohydrolase family protein [Phycicoccus sp.]HQV90586.1 amidohydrolase family protein [Phycicoccus sp.]HQY96439.1 amidohydrolase family protein [Phycicoccus sp.]HRA44681.1 amidohydrolase family protein [Phycicoccus sp.]
MSMISLSGPPAGDAAPGLLDIHCHGAMGQQFGDDPEGTRLAVEHHRSRGVRGLVASLVTAAPERLAGQVATLAPLVADGTIAGIHLEGPWLSVARCGAHDPHLLRDPDPTEVEHLLEIGASAGVPQAIRQVTFAPERPGSDRLIQLLADHGVRPAVGHTDADARTITRALATITDATGAPALVTHLFNGMPPFHHRNGGPVAAAIAAAAKGEAIVELIADGVHVGPEVIRVVFDTVGPDRIALISDAMAATGLGDGDYRIGDLAVDVRDGTARLHTEDGTGSIAGSTSTLSDILRFCIVDAGIDADDARAAATRTPAYALGL